MLINSNCIPDFTGRNFTITRICRELCTVQLLFIFAQVNGQANGVYQKSNNECKISRVKMDEKYEKRRLPSFCEVNHSSWIWTANLTSFEANWLFPVFQWLSRFTWNLKTESRYQPITRGQENIKSWYSLDRGRIILYPNPTYVFVRSLGTRLNMGRIDHTPWKALKECADGRNIWSYKHYQIFSKSCSKSCLSSWKLCYFVF